MIQISSCKVGLQGPHRISSNRVPPGLLRPLPPGANPWLGRVNLCKYPEPESAVKAGVVRRTPGAQLLIFWSMAHSIVGRNDRPSPVSWWVLWSRCIPGKIVPASAFKAASGSWQGGSCAKLRKLRNPPEGSASAGSEFLAYGTFHYGLE